MYATEDAKQLEKVESHVLHDACNDAIHMVADADKLRNSLPEMNGFMKVSQLKQLLEMPFCHLALHGCCHLKMPSLKNARSNNLTLLKMMKIFKQDVDSGILRLHELDLETKIFVYPYIYSFPTSDSYLKKVGFTQIIGSQDTKIFRIAIEDLLANRPKYDS